MKGPQENFNCAELGGSASPKALPTRKSTTVELGGRASPKAFPGSA